MPRKLWSGRLVFGLVPIPVAIHAAVERSPETGRQPASDEPRVGGESAPDGGRPIEILRFVELSSLSPLLFETSFHLVPEEGGERGYGLLRDALVDCRRVGIARFELAGEPVLAALLAGRQVLSLIVLRSPAELCSLAELNPAASTPRPEELKLARALIDELTDEWDPTAQPSVYQRVLEKVLHSDESPFASAMREAPPAGGRIIDLSEALEKSLGLTDNLVSEAERPHRRGAA